MMDRELKKEKINRRITELDLFRGIAVLLMIFDHAMYDLWGFLPEMFESYPTAIQDFAVSYWVWGVREAVRYVVIFVFLALTGISCSFSKSNLKRGLKLLGVALILTLGTYITGLIMQCVDDVLIVFGVLHMIAFSIIVIALIEMLTDNKYVYLAIGVVLVVIGIIISSGDVPSVGFDGNFFELFFKAFIGKVLLGADSFGFPLYGGQIFIGVFLGKLLYSERKPLLFKSGYKNNPITFIGRHALIVYVAHQIIIPIIIGLILLIFGYKLAF